MSKHSSLRSRFFRFILAMALSVVSLSSVSQIARAAPQMIYEDALAAGWEDYSWANINLQATSPTHNGSAHSISVTYNGWDGLYLYYPSQSTIGYTYLHFFVHGGSSGGQHFQVMASRADDSYGPAITVPVPTANVWSEVKLALADLGVADTELTGLTWQGTVNGAQPTLYIDDISLSNDENPAGPVLSNGVLMRSAAPADGVSGVVARVQVSDPQGASDIASVTLNASALGRGHLTLRDDGRSNDGAANDGIFGTVFTVAPGTPRGEYMLVITARDQANHRNIWSLGSFVVLSTPGGTVPGSLPARPAWGTDEWSETPGQDWQVNSDVAWDYVYQYITYGWETWGTDFVRHFVDQAWSKGYVPVISVYMMLEVPTNCGEGASCYASKLQNATTVSNYLASLARAASQATGNKRVIFQLEPDFYGTMQQYRYANNHPQPDDPSTYPVALNVSGYPNNLAGFGQRLVDVIHTAAPNALVAPHASMWATDKDPNSVPMSEVSTMAQHTVAFINAMGGTQADLLFVEWGDRDAGSGLRPWWDDTNHTLPRPSRAVLWESALSAASGKRLILWQVPAGNMSLKDICHEYRDNRAAYAFRHPRDLYEAGVIAVLFGGGEECMTSASTDGGFIKAQGGIAYNAPAAPTGLSASAPTGPSVQLRWNENSEPDLWGYRLRYTPLSTSVPITVDVGPANATQFVIPAAGQWQVTALAYDAMGRLSVPGNTVTVTIFVDATHVYLPLIRK